MVELAFDIFFFNVQKKVERESDIKRGHDLGFLQIL